MIHLYRYPCDTENNSVWCGVIPRMGRISTEPYIINDSESYEFFVNYHKTELCEVCLLVLWAHKSKTGDFYDSPF